MTREEERSKAAYSQYCNSESICFNLMCDSFKQGAKWADEHPINVWHDVNEEPKRGSLILLIMQSGTAIVAKIIESDHTFNHGERWAYISDILPKDVINKNLQLLEDDKAGRNKICK